MTRINIRDYLHFPEENDCTCEFESNLDQKNEMQEAFMLYDKDGDGLIDTKDIGTVIRSLGQVLTVCEETDIVAQYAQEKCYEINYVAFVKLMNAQYKTVDHDDQLREAFRRFDKEENGFVNEEEIKSMLMTLGEPLSKAEVENWIKGGENFIRNGKIYYEELATFMLSK